MRGVQDEQYRYFYMDRKLRNGGLQELEEVLEEIDGSLDRMRQPDFVYSLLMRLLELLPNARSFPLKHRTAALLRRHAARLLALPAFSVREEVAAVLASCLNGSDEFTRVVALRLVGSLVELFARDTAVYHTLLAKLGAGTWLSREERAAAVGSLGALLGSSRHLGRLFGKHFQQLQEQYGFPLHVGLYLLTQVKADSHLQQLVLSQAAALLPPLPTPAQTRYFRKLVLLYARSNYRVLALCLSKWQQQLQGMTGMLQTIAAAHFPFLDSGGSAPSVPLSLPMLVDELYSRKQEGVEADSLQPVIERVFVEAVRGGQRDAVLILYFWNNSLQYLEEGVGRLMRSTAERGRKRLFKQLAVVGCYSQALELLHCLPLPQSNYLQLRMYLSFKASPSAASLNQLIEMAELLNPTFAQLASAWLQFHQLLTATATQQFLPILQSLKNCGFSCEYELLRTAFDICSEGSSQVAPLRCAHLLPSSTPYEPFWFAYLGKKAILRLCKD